MDGLGNDLSPFCAFHKNEVTISRRWLMCVSKTCKLGNKVNVESSGCLRSCSAQSTPVSVPLLRPGCVLPARAALSLRTHRQLSNCWLSPAGWPRSQTPSWGQGEGKVMKVFLQECYCCLPCSGGAQLFAAVTIWLCCIWERPQNRHI